jgi:DNA primase
VAFFPYESQLSQLSQGEVIMSILDLAEELNLSPKRVASSNGGEYKASCPRCKDGKDRFCIWPNQGVTGRYWCRVCECKGDGIQFCKDFLGMTFHQACQKMHVIPRYKEQLISTPFKKTKFIPHMTLPVHQSWQEAAREFIESSHRTLMKKPDALELLFQRGLSLDTIRRFWLGWNNKTLFEERETWGKPQEMKENGSLRHQWLPKGIVIPSYSGNEPVKIKIRRSDWHEEDPYPKYIEVSGSKQSPSTYGDMSKPVVVVESELDAILIQQSASDLVCCLALGGVSKKPDCELHPWLQQAPLILLSLDFDEAGKKKCAFWMKLYPNLRLWPTPCSKSPGDAAKLFHVDILNWIKLGLY